MERITAKEVTSMMEALSQVYEQPEVEQLDEALKGPDGKPLPISDKVRNNAAYATQAAKFKRENPGVTDYTAYRMGGGDAARRNTGNLANNRTAVDVQRQGERNIQRNRDMVKDNQTTGVGPKPSKPDNRTTQQKVDSLVDIFAKANPNDKTVQALVKNRQNRNGGGGELPSGGERPSGGSNPAPASKPTSTFKVGDKQMSKAQINARYAELRKTDPKAAKEFGKQAFAATNSKIATANAERSRIRGTAQTNNPLIDKQMRSRMPVNSPSVQSSEVSKLGKGNQSLSNNPNALRAAKPAAASSTTTSSGSVKQEIAAVKSRMSANQQTSVNNAVKSGIQKVGTKVGNTIKTKVNPDSSMSVTQKRDPKVTANIKKSLERSSVDLFDIVKGEFIEEGYSEEDTMYMMANLNEEQLQEFLRQLAGVAIKNVNKIPGVRGVVSKVGRMFGRSPKPTRIPAGDIGAMRLYQDKAKQSVNRLNKSTAVSKANDATRSATRETNRLNNLDPRAVSDANKRREASQVIQRNLEKGRPSFAGPQPVDRLDYKPGDPMFTDHLKRYYAAKRRGDKGLPN